MGTLKEMLGFLNETGDSLRETTGKLGKIQQYFNENFNNVAKVRKSELEFLQKSFFEQPSEFPEEIRDAYSKAVREEEKVYLKNLSELKGRHDRLKKELDDCNENRNTVNAKIDASNIKLDSSEESLKKKIQSFEKEIEAFNKRIDELNSGFGFIINFFRMKKIEKEKDEIIEKRDSLALAVENIRLKWTEAEAAYETEITRYKEKWNELTADLSISEEKIGTLTNEKTEIIRRAAFMDAMDSLQGGEDFLTSRIGTTPPGKCRRCGSENESNLFFCRYCGERFAADRPDVTESLVETGELNRVYGELLSGIRQSVSFLALIKGISEGVKTFSSSVQKVKNSQDKYPSLSTLMINVPDVSKDFQAGLLKLNKDIDVKFLNLHPAAFASSYKEFEEKHLTTENIELFFRAMGDELNKRTKEQW